MDFNLGNTVDFAFGFNGSGGGSAVQSDWEQDDPGAPDFIKNKPTIPPAVTVDQTYDATSTNPQSGTAVAQAIASSGGDCPPHVICSPAEYESIEHDSGTLYIVEYSDSFTMYLGDKPLMAESTDDVLIGGNGVAGSTPTTFTLAANLNQVQIPSGVTSIKISAFYGYTGLTDIYIPSSVEQIETGAFSGCTNLTNITIAKAENSISGAPWDAPNENLVITWEG